MPSKMSGISTTLPNLVIAREQIPLRKMKATDEKLLILALTNFKIEESKNYYRPQ